MKLYAVVTIERKLFYREDGSSYTSNDSRTVMISADLEKARQMVLKNTWDVYEMGSYPYAVVEEFEEGSPYGLGKDGSGKQWWFHWRGPVDEGRYMVMGKRPKWAQRVFAWWG